jgi:hypothetical protein
VEAAEIADDFGNPTFRPVIDHAAMFVFENCCPSYSPSRERRAALKSYIAGRAITMPLLFEAWKNIQENEQRGFSRELLRNDEPAQENLDDLDDAGVEKLYKQTRSYIARTYPAPGILQ